MIIYKTTNLLNGKVYIGQDSHNNPNYLGSGILLIRAIKKYGRENFKKEVIDIAESLEDLNEKEIYWIKFCNCKTPNGYNLTDGGEGSTGFIFSEQSKRKLSEIRRGKKRKPCSEERKKKISEGCKGKNTGESNPAKRLEVRQKISKNNPNKRLEVREKKRKLKPEGFGQKVSERQKGKKRGPNKKKSKIRSDKGKKRGKQKKNLKEQNYL
jgi:group I intron endonuclease